MIAVCSPSLQSVCAGSAQMISLHYFLDTRRTPAGTPAPLKMIFTKRQRNGMLATGIDLLPEQWDAQQQKIVKHPRAKALNGHISRLKGQAEDFILPQLYSGKLAALSAVEIKDMFAEFLLGDNRPQRSLAEVMAAFIGNEKTKNTAASHRSAWTRVCRVRPDAESLPVSRVTPAWVAALDDALVADGLGANTRRVTFGVLSAAWRTAGLEGNPFRVKIPQPLTAKRDLTLDQMRTLWNAEPRDRAETDALDFFKVSFLLRAANPVDILRLAPADMVNGRIYYIRAKTGKPYSVKVEPELTALLAGRGDGAHLWHAHIPTYTQYINKALKRIAAREGLPNGLSMYWVRHSVASLLYNRGVPMDIVSATLGHSLGGARVTAVYVDDTLVQVDKAFRALLDALLHDEG